MQRLTPPGSSVVTNQTSSNNERGSVRRWCSAERERLVCCGLENQSLRPAARRDLASQSNEASKCAACIANARQTEGRDGLEVMPGAHV